MKSKLLTITCLTITIMLLNSCEKEQLIELPQSINLGESQVFLNGELVEFLPTVRLDTLNSLLNFSFVETQNNGEIVTSVSFSWLPISVGDYILHTERKFFLGALTSFSQLVAEDLKGYSYELIDEENGFFNVETLDLNNKIISGRFQVNFRRTSKNGNSNLGLPKKIAFQGIFHEQY